MMQPIRLPRWHQRSLFFVAATLIACCFIFQVIYSSHALENLHVPSVRREAAFVRAIVVHLPRDRDDDAVDEFRWLHASWKDMVQHQPSTWRTDLVVVPDGAALAGGDGILPSDLKCTASSRVNRLKPSQCFVLPSTHSATDVAFTVDFDVVHSFQAMTTADLSVYDWVLITHPNAIIGPAFAGWKPTVLTVGSGLSDAPFSNSVLHAMKSIGQDLGLTSFEPTKHTFGLSWYGPTSDVQECGKLMLELLEHLHQHLERGALNEASDWHRALPEVAASIALPECTQFNVAFQPSMLDVPVLRLDAVSRHAVLIPSPMFTTLVYEKATTSLLQNDHSTIGFALAIARSSTPAVNPLLLQNELTTALNQSSFVRAIVVSFRLATNRTGHVELRGLHRSWQIMLRDQPPAWRTDLVVFADTPSRLFDQLKCSSSFVRQAGDDTPSRCIAVIVANSPDSAQSDVGGILATLAMHPPVLASYEWLLRSDLDTFVAPRFAMWKPSQFSVSRPIVPYCVPGTFTCANLARVASEMGFQVPVKRQAYGSTWYGPSKMVQTCAKVAMRVIDHLTNVGSPSLDNRQGHLDAQRTNLPLYAGHVALQQCTTLPVQRQRPDVLEVSTSSSRPLDSMVHLKAGTDEHGLSLFHAAKLHGDVGDTAIAKDFAAKIAWEAAKDVTDDSIQRALHESFVRAAVVYLPGDNTKFQAEMRWLHASWVDMVQHQPAKWRTDIVVFTDGDLPLWTDLNCTTTIRTSPDDPNRCVLVPGYKKVKSSSFDYGFADSINVVAIANEATKPYDWILRTDIDTFFTPAFATWKPLKFTVGSVGGYCFDGYDTCDRLAGIATKLKLQVSPVEDIGSTWYGPRQMVQDCGKLSMKVIDHLHLHEFNATEKSDEYAKVRVAGWPRWHYGVLTMYSGHLAIPSCTNSTGFDKLDAMLDYPTYSNDIVANHAHLHARQNYESFSKFDFQKGEYDHIDPETLDRSIVSQHATYMALTSQYAQVPASSNQSDSFVRAAVVFAPEGSGEAGFRWFHLSWQTMALKEPALWRTDLVVFATEEWPYFCELNCTSVPRRDRVEPNRCIVVSSYKSVMTSDFAFAKADDVHILTTHETYLDTYDWLLKTDLETFLTPAFATWKPTSFTFGSSGGYSFPGQPTAKRLASIAATLQLTGPTVEDIGSSWYGPASVVRSCATLAVRLMHYLHAHEFNATEKSPEYYQVKIAGWPHWHYGILHMYAGHLAVPHCTKDSGGFTKQTSMMDFSTESKASVKKHAHLRSAQGSTAFSSRAFRAGQYKDVKLMFLKPLVVSDYALFMALKSKAMADAAPLPFDNGLNDTFVRAAVVYLPSTGDLKFQAEMRWLHASWVDMVQHQPAKWRTDIVVFTDGDLPLWKYLNCTTTIRTSPDDPNRCVLVPGYKKVKSSSFDYGFADSINV
ncbi:hypothetical protein DYB34_011641, partial [Aphanomyces astaci]